MTMAPVTLTAFPKNYGVYNIVIRPTMESASGSRPFASFVLGRSNNDKEGTCNRFISVKGNIGSQLDMRWHANTFPHVFYHPAPNSDTTTEYTYKISTV